MEWALGFTLLFFLVGATHAIMSRRETAWKLQMEMMRLKFENERLRTELADAMALASEASVTALEQVATDQAAVATRHRREMLERLQRRVALETTSVPTTGSISVGAITINLPDDVSSEQFSRELEKLRAR